jgi:hypothetical protein
MVLVSGDAMILSCDVMGGGCYGKRKHGPQKMAENLNNSLPGSQSPEMIIITHVWILHISANLA